MTIPAGRGRYASSKHSELKHEAGWMGARTVDGCKERLWA